MAEQAQPFSDIWHADVRQRLTPALFSGPLPDSAAGAAAALTWSTDNQPAAVCRDAVVQKYGQRFVWTEAHRTAAQLEPLRQRGDQPMDDALGGDAGDALAQLQDAAARDPSGAAAALLDAAARPPVWVDWQ